MIIEEIIFLNGACSRKGNGLLFFARSGGRCTLLYAFLRTQLQ